MRDILLSRLPRSLTIDGKTYYVEPSTIRDVCELFVCRSGCLALEASHVHTVRAALRRWWGDEILKALDRVLYPPTKEGFELLFDRYIIPMALEGCPVKVPEAGLSAGTEKEIKSVEGYIDSIVEMDLRRRLALYCTTFPAADPVRVYETMSFSMFIALYEEVDRMIAYHNYERLVAQALMSPGEDRREAEQQMTDYMERAGLRVDRHYGQPHFTRAELEADPEKMEIAKRHWMGAVEYARTIKGGSQGDA